LHGRREVRFVAEWLDLRMLAQMNARTARILAGFAGLLLMAAPVQAQLRGHGGPVRTVAISPDGTAALSGSFDSSAIRWSLARNAAEQVLRFHDDAVNAVALLKDGRAVTAGADGRIAIWSGGKQQPDTVLQGHTAPIVALAVSPDGATLASAAWDNTVRLWPLAGGEPRVLEGHTQNVNGVAFTADGKSVVSASYDLTLRIWPLDDGVPTIVTLPAPLSAVAGAPDEIVAAGANGVVYFLNYAGERKGEVQVSPTPVISLAVSPDGALVAAAGIRGSVAVIERKERKLARTLVGPGLPVWSVVFLPDSRTMLTGGTDRVIRRWDAVTGDHIGAVTMD
jgi:cytochrome c